MTRTRRDVLAAAATGTAAAFLAPAAFASGASGMPRPARAPVARADEPLDILVMGGTGFLGPHLIHVALERGHNVTMFNRGRTEPSIFVDQYERVEALEGDRRDADAVAAALGGDRRWHAVLDTSAYYPRVVDIAAGLLKDRVDHYSLISTISVYGERNDVGMDEDAPVDTIEDETLEEVTPLSYGPLKALCEAKATEIMPGRAANIRPGLIVGKGDNTDRYTYWVDRIHRGGRVLAPGPDDYTQIIDVRDLAEFTVHLAERRTAGTFNVVTPQAGLTMKAMLGAIDEVTPGDAELVWVDGAWLIEQGVQPWQQMTAWVPPTLPGYEGFGQISTKRAIDAGLRTRTAQETAQATLDWWLTLPEERRRNLRAGLPEEREAEVLAAWDAREG